MACSSRCEALLRLTDRQHHLLQHKALLRMLELLARDPAHMRLGPGLPALRVRPSQPQQKGRDMLALRAQIQHRRLARPCQIAHRLVTSVRHPDRREFVGTQQLCQAERVTPVGLHLVAWSLWNQRRRHHHAFEAQPLDLPVQSVAGRPCLVAERQPLVLAGKLPNELRRCGRRVLDLPKEPNLATPAGIRNRNRIPQLRRIDPDESLAIITHDSPSLREALPGLSG